MKFWSMRVSQVLQLSTLLVGLHHVWCSPALGQVPVSQVKMLSLGLAHLLEEVTENVERLEQHGEMMGREMDGAMKRLESLRKKNIQVGRTHKQVSESSVNYFSQQIRQPSVQSLPQNLQHMLQIIYFGCFLKLQLTTLKKTVNFGV